MAKSPRLFPDIVSLSPSGYEEFGRCRRLFLCKSVLGIPESDPGVSSDQGLIVHDMLWKIHERGSCADEAHVVDVLEAHGVDTPAIRALVDRHAARCPARGAEHQAHEHELARFHRFPPPMFMATARIDAIWVHDGILDARDYKTGARFEDRVADIRAAHVQAWVLGRAAQQRGLRLQLRYEYLQPEIDDDPDPWELGDEELTEVEAELSDAVAAMVAETDWPGVAAADVCRTCRYRSICRDSAAPGEPAWPVLASEGDS